MKYNILFGNPSYKKASKKSGKAVKSIGAKDLLAQLNKGKKKNKSSAKGILSKIKNSKKASKKVPKEKDESEDTTIKENKMAKKKKKAVKKAGKKKVAKKVAKKKVAKKVAKKAKRKVARKAKRKVAKKAFKKVAKKKVARKAKRKSYKKSAKKKSYKKSGKRKSAKRAKKRKSSSRGSGATRYVSYNSKTKPRYSSIKRLNKKKKNKKGYYKTRKGKKFIIKMLNPFGGSMSKIEKFTGMSLPEAGGLLVGGLAYGAINSLLAKIPVVDKIHAQLIKVPVVGSALPTLLAGAICNFIGDKKNIKPLKMLGTGLVGSAIVGMGVNASQLVPGLSSLSGVDFTMGEGQLGYNPADFGELPSINNQSFSGVDYTMNGVDYTMGEDNPADFGELIQVNDEALSGGQLG